MTQYLKYLIVFLTCLTSEVGMVVNGHASDPTAETARESLKTRAFPWYDADKDSFRPLRPLKEEKSENSPAVDLSKATPGGSASIPQILMWMILAAFISGLLILMIRSAINAESLIDSSTDRATATIALETLEALPEPARGVRDLLAEAAHLASQSSFGAAMTFYYSWQLVQLDQQQLVEVQKGKTNRQYSRELGVSMPDLVGVFEQSMRLFEDAFFGDLPITSEEFQQVWEQRNRFVPRPRRTRS